MSILSPNQSRMTEQAKFIFLPLGKNFEKQTKAKRSNSRAWEKQIEALQALGLNGQESQNKIFIESVKETTKEIGGLEKKLIMASYCL